VKRSFVRLFGLLGLASSLAAAGCGGGGDSPATYGSAIESCSQYCEAYVARSCVPTYTDDGFCKIDKCSPIPQTAPADCYAATQSLWVCLKAQSDICTNTGCANQEAAALAACP